MSEKHFKVAVQGDHLKKLAVGRPVPALAELVWNSVDADATHVAINVEYGELGMSAITVKDNGHGINRDDIERLFGQLGGSWKALGNRSKSKGRMLHGREGKGRLKALALGRVADWIITQDHPDGRYTYTISLIRDDLVDVRVSDPELTPNAKIGTEVRVSELHREYRSLQGENPVQELSETFALYLSDYSDVSIEFEGEPLDPSSAIEARYPIELDSIQSGDGEVEFELELIEWKTTTERVVYLCTENGFPLHKQKPRMHAPGFKFSAYLKSRYISDLHENGALALAEMDPLVQLAYEQAQERIKQRYKEREADKARSEIEKWKTEEIYPYVEEPQNSIEMAERKVFDIVALNVNSHLPSFPDSDKKTKAFQLRMLRQAIESGPEELQAILGEVLDLPEGKRNELARLLEESSLANVISASKMVADRQKFLQGLETILFDPELKADLKERSQLHKILADENTWIFGEEFSLTVNDRSLTEVLRAHKKLLAEDIVIDKPVTKLDKSVGIVDLMLSKAVPRNHVDELEHLVVELKRPTVKVGSKEITQIKEYAYAVAADERFRHLNTRWSFWVISNDLNEFALRETRQKDKPNGLIMQSEDGQIEIWVKTWSEVINVANSRMRFVQDHLQTSISKESALDYLRTTYEKYLSVDSEQNSSETAAVPSDSSEART